MRDQRVGAVREKRQEGFRTLDIFTLPSERRYENEAEEWESEFITLL